MVVENKKDDIFGKVMYWLVPIIIVIVSFIYLMSGRSDWFGIVSMGVIWLGILIRRVMYWIFPVIIVIVSLSYIDTGHYDWFGIFFIGAIWLGVLIYFRFFRKKKKK